MMQHSRHAGDLQPRSVGGLAASDLRAASLFVRLGMSLVDDEAASVEEACSRHGLDAGDVTRALADMDAPGAHLALTGVPWWALDDICALIVDRHHSHLTRESEALCRRLAELEETEGLAPEWAAVRTLMVEVTELLRSHLSKEENILFPALESLARARRAGSGRPGLPFPTVLHPIRVMEADHTRLSEQMARLTSLFAGMAPAAGVSDLWQRTARDLEIFDLDLAAHMRFEDDLLFPRALELERLLP